MEKPDKISRILMSSEGKMELEPNPFLYTRIVSKLSEEKGQRFSATKIALVSASFILLIAVNIVGFALQEETNTTENNSEQLAIEENNNINSNFHLY